MDNGEQYVAALDVGTTSVRCHIINSQTKCVSASSLPINLIYDSPGYVEIDPYDLWDNVCTVIKQAILGANLSPFQIKCLGISTQRATFTTWNKNTGKTYHNFITWKDLRADELVNKWNSSYSMKFFRTSTYMLYLVTRNKRYAAASSYTLANTQVTIRLLWVLENIPELKDAVAKQNAMFGTIDTWLIYKFSDSKMHVTDITSASATGMFDPFVLSWASWARVIFSVPVEILPKVVENDYAFGSTSKDIFGAPIPIKCVISDQSASMFGSCCFKPGDTKITMGTGSFIDLNTNSSLHSSAGGLYPLVGWKLNDKLTYFIEGACNDTGSLIEWSLKSGLINNPSETSEMASQLQSNDGVYFIPAFSGLGPPIKDDNAASGFIGLKVTSTKHHMVRAILEGIVYRITLLHNMFKKETNFKMKRICVDGGVSKNNFMCQLLANLLGVEVARQSTTEMTTLGVAFIAGLNADVWKTREELVRMQTFNCIFQPSSIPGTHEECLREFNKWLKAVERFKTWYSS